MNERETPWLPADEAPTLTPLLCYWCPSPDADDEEDRPEFWGVAVRCKEFGVDRWYQHCPLWEKGLGNPYFSEPDFFAPLGRPEGNPKWVIGSDDSVAYLKGYNCPESMSEVDTDPRRTAAHKATMPRLGPERSTVPLKVDGCGGEDDERR